MWLIWRVVVALPVATIGVLLVAHGMYEAQHPDWRDRDWWGSTRAGKLLLGGTAADLLEQALGGSTELGSRVHATVRVLFGVVFVVFAAVMLATIPAGAN
jgi:peptidoglycan/LPS O-acetylase OafA/YrhL